MTISVTLNLDENAIGALDRLAASSGSTRDALASLALEAYAEDQAWQIERIETGLAAADQNRFASDDEVQRVKAKFAPPL